MAQGECVAQEPADSSRGGAVGARGHDGKQDGRGHLEHDRGGDLRSLRLDEPPLRRLALGPVHPIVLKEFSGARRVSKGGGGGG